MTIQDFRSKLEKAGSVSLRPYSSLVTDAKAATLKSDVGLAGWDPWPSEG